MKKLITLLLVVALALTSVLALAACGETQQGESIGKVAAYSVDLTDLGYDLKVTNGTWQETYDAIISLVKKEGNASKRYQLMHRAEDLLMSTACLTPIYFYTDIYMLKDNVKGFFSSPLGYKFFSGTSVGGDTSNIDICLASEPDTIDPALNSAVDGATLTSHLFAGLIKWELDDKGVLQLVPDCAKSVPTPTIGSDGKATYVFELKDGLKWSDGSALTAKDFEYSWKRASSAELAADYGYMFDVIDGYTTDDEGLFNGELNVKASEDGKTLTVVLSIDTTYFIELCAFPAYFPVKQSVVEADPDGWATDPSTYISNGAYTMQSWDHGSKMVLVKNDGYWDADSVTMKKITNHLSDDDGSMLANFKTGDWVFIDSVPNDEIENLKTQYPTEFVIAGQLGTYYACFNINADLLPSTSTLTGIKKVRALEEIRKALSALLDRNYICEQIGKAGQLPASSFVAQGLTEPDGSEFYKNAGNSDSFVGYYDVSKEAFSGNVAAALDILKKYYEFDSATGKFTNFPTIEYILNNSSGHQKIAEYIQGAYAAYGINVNLTAQEWNTFLNTRKDGNYTMARNGWLGDYNDPISFLDMWTSGSGNNDVQFGR